MVNISTRCNGKTCKNSIEGFTEEVYNRLLDRLLWEDEKFRNIFYHTGSSVWASSLLILASEVLQEETCT